MKNIVKSNSLFVLLLMIGTSCIAQTLKNQLNNKYHFHQLSRKYPTMNLGCNVLWAQIDICPNQIGGSASITSDIRPVPYGPTCNCIDFQGNVVNISSSKNDTCDSYHYSGNLTVSVSPGYRYNSNINTNDHMAANDIPSGIYNYTINAYINLCNTGLYANVALCNNGSCVIYDPIGAYSSYRANDTCTCYDLQMIIHSINETNTHI
jgi:hypothetical protein